MGYIPDGAKWYLAEVVEEITVEGDPRNVVHTNVVLVRADSPAEAYEKSLALGQQSETSYKNPAGKHVGIVFKGLHDLNVIHDELGHGAELIFSEEVGMSAERLRGWLAAKEELGIFRPIRPSSGPDYASGDIVQEVYERFGHLRPSQATASERGSNG
ncbi:MAG: DUF4288 domain-containing protein [Terriglobia bacterium]